MRDSEACYENFRGISLRVLNCVNKSFEGHAGLIGEQTTVVQKTGGGTS